MRFSPLQAVDYSHKTLSDRTSHNIKKKKNYLVLFSANDKLGKFKGSSYSPSDWWKGAPWCIGRLRGVLSD